MTLRKEFEETINCKGVEKLFESGDKYYIKFLEEKIKQMADLQLQISVLRNDIEELRKMIKDPVYYHRGAE